MGTHALRAIRSRGFRVRDRGLRLWRSRVLRARRRPAGHPRGVHAGLRSQRERLLRREPRRRLQRAGARGARVGGGERELVPAHGLPRRPEHVVPARAARRRGVGCDGGVPERVRGVRHDGVLLQRRARDAGDVPAHGLLALLQGVLPARLQLRLRRRHVDVHLRRRRGRRRVRRRVLPRRVELEPRSSSAATDNHSLPTNGVLIRGHRSGDDQPHPSPPLGHISGDVDMVNQ